MDIRRNMILPHSVPFRDISEHSDGGVELVKAFCMREQRSDELPIVSPLLAMSPACFCRALAQSAPIVSLQVPGGSYRGNVALESTKKAAQPWTSLSSRRFRFSGIPRKKSRTNTAAEMPLGYSKTAPSVHVRLELTLKGDLKGTAPTDVYSRPWMSHCASVPLGIKLHSRSAHDATGAPSASWLWAWTELARRVPATAAMKVPYRGAIFTSYSVHGGGGLEMKESDDVVSNVASVGEGT